MGLVRDRLGTGLQSIQISPCHAGLAGRRSLRLRYASRFAAMLLSLAPFGSGKAADLEDVLQILSQLRGDTV